MAGKIQVGGNFKIEDILANLEEIVGGLDASKIDLSLPSLNLAQEQSIGNQDMIDTILQEKEMQKRRELAQAKGIMGQTMSDAKSLRVPFKNRISGRN